jgi:ATP-dependent Clp protease ATP-binding subunit ClpC
MSDRFSTEARQAVIYAQNAAENMKHPYIGSEHILLGLLQLEGGAAIAASQSLNVELAQVQSEIIKLVGSPDYKPDDNRNFTPLAKQVLEKALREVLVLGDSTIDTHHLLLALSTETQGMASHILESMGITTEKLRNALEEASLKEQAGPD